MSSNMDINEATKYIGLVDKLKGKYELRFSQSKQKFAFQERQEDSSKVKGMLLGLDDYLVSFTLGDDVLDVSFGGGLEIKGRLCDCDSAEFVRILGLVKMGGYSGDRVIERRWMKDAESDLCFLRDSEKLIYNSGLVLPGCKAFLNVY